MAYARLRIEQRNVYYLDVLTPDGATIEEQVRALDNAIGEEELDVVYAFDTLGRMVHAEGDECIVSSKAITAIEYRETNGFDAYDAFETRCPYCLHDGMLHVVSVMLEADGEIYEVEAQILRNGFDIYGQVPDFKDLSTSDEIVKCTHCGRLFPLSDVSLE